QISALVALTMLLSAGGIYGDHPDYREHAPCDVRKPNWYKTLVPCVFGLVGYSVFTDFVDSDVSTRPKNWHRHMTREEVEAIRGARLPCADLRFADAQRAYLANADLRKANLRGAYLEAVELSGAQLAKADLRHTTLKSARLRYADLTKADLRGTL